MRWIRLARLTWRTRTSGSYESMFGNFKSADKSEPLEPQVAARLAARRRAALGMLGTEQKAIEPHSISRAMIRAQLEVMGFTKAQIDAAEKSLEGRW